MRVGSIEPDRQVGVFETSFPGVYAVGDQVAKVDFDRSRIQRWFGRSWP